MNESNEYNEIDEQLTESDGSEERKQLLDENGVDIYTKKSGEKTVDERIKTSRTLKIKHNKWNQVDYTEDYLSERITIDPKCYQYSSSFDDVELENKFQDIIEDSKYKELLLGSEKTTITYQIINDIIRYCYGKLKRDYSLARVFVLSCEYCGVGLATMWKRLCTDLQEQILDDLKEVSRIPNEVINNNIKMW